MDEKRVIDRIIELQKAEKYAPGTVKEKVKSKISQLKNDLNIAMKKQNIEDKMSDHFINSIKVILEFLSRKTTYQLYSWLDARQNQRLQIILCFKSYNKSIYLSDIFHDKKSLNDSREDGTKILRIINELYHKYYGLQNQLAELFQFINDKNQQNICERYDFQKYRFCWGDEGFYYPDACDTSQFNNEEELMNKELKIGSIIVDPLGLYIWHYDNNDNNHNKIILFCDKMIDVASRSKVNLYALLEVVIVHELAHAYHHIGFDPSGEINDNFSELNTNIKEGFANFMVDNYIDWKYKSERKAGNILNKAFKNATCQEGPYNVYRKWLKSGYTLKTVNATNEWLRSYQGINTIDELNDNFIQTLNYFHNQFNY